MSSLESGTSERDTFRDELLIVRYSADKKVYQFHRL